MKSNVTCFGLGIVKKVWRCKSACLCHSRNAAIHTLCMNLIQYKMVTCGTILILRCDVQESLDLECKMGCASEEQSAYIFVWLKFLVVCSFVFVNGKKFYIWILTVPCVIYIFFLGNLLQILGFILHFMLSYHQGNAVGVHVKYMLFFHCNHNWKTFTDFRKPLHQQISWTFIWWFSSY